MSIDLWASKSDALHEFSVEAYEEASSFTTRYAVVHYEDSGEMKYLGCHAGPPSMSYGAWSDSDYAAYHKDMAQKITIYLNDAFEERLQKTLTPDLVSVADSSHTFGLNEEKCIQAINKLMRTIGVRVAPIDTLREETADPAAYVSATIGVLQRPGHVSFGEGASYDGENFCSDQLCGRGTYKYGNGVSYVGDFRNNVRFGPAVVMMLDGSILKATFDNDAVTKSVVVLLPNLHEVHRDSYQGNLDRHGLYSGRGIYASRVHSPNIELKCHFDGGVVDDDNCQIDYWMSDGPSSRLNSVAIRKNRIVDATLLKRLNLSDADLTPIVRQIPDAILQTLEPQ